jgi:hypothetical protein
VRQIGAEWAEGTGFEHRDLPVVPGRSIRLSYPRPVAPARDGVTEATIRELDPSRHCASAISTRTQLQKPWHRHYLSLVAYKQWKSQSGQAHRRGGEEIMNLSEAFLKLAGYLGIAGVSIAAIVTAAYQLFKHLGTHWLDDKFQQRLETFKHLQNQEIERLRLEINSTFDRRVKLHQREFEVIPEMLALIVDAYVTASQFTSVFQSYPDLQYMELTEFEAFLQKSELEDWQKVKVKASSDRNDTYQNEIYRHQARLPQEAYHKYRMHFLKNGIFLPKNLKERFVALDDLIYEANQEKLINNQMKGHSPRSHVKSDALRKNGENVYATLEQEVERVLRSDNLQFS